MPAVELTIEMPEGSWIAAVTRSFSETDFRVLTVLVNEGSGHAVLEVETAEPSAILGSLQSRPELTSVDLISVDSARGVFQIETLETGILEPFLSAGVPLETPIHIGNGVATWEFTTSQDRLSKLSTHLQESGMEYHVDRIGEENPNTKTNGPDLTDRQSEIFQTAHQLGYFEIPRDATIREVAETTGVSKSTASDTLRRAIRNVVGWYRPAD